MSSLVDVIKAHHGLFDAVTLVLGSAINGLTWLLAAIPPLLFVAIVGWPRLIICGDRSR